MKFKEIVKKWIVKPKIPWDESGNKRQPPRTFIKTYFTQEKNQIINVLLRVKNFIRRYFIFKFYYCCPLFIYIYINVSFYVLKNRYLLIDNFYSSFFSTIDEANPRISILSRIKIKKKIKKNLRKCSAKNKNSEKPLMVLKIYFYSFLSFSHSKTKLFCNNFSILTLDI